MKRLFMAVMIALICVCGTFASAWEWDLNVGEVGAAVFVPFDGVDPLNTLGYGIGVSVANVTHEFGGVGEEAGYVFEAELKVGAYEVGVDETWLTIGIEIEQLNFLADIFKKLTPGEAADFIWDDFATVGVYAGYRVANQGALTKLPEDEDWVYGVSITLVSAKVTF